MWKFFFVELGYPMATPWAFDIIENVHIYIVQKIIWKCFVVPWECLLQIELFWKEENATINKKELKLHQDMTNFTFTEKDSQKFLLKIEIIETLEITALLHVSVGV